MDVENPCSKWVHYKLSLLLHNDIIKHYSCVKVIINNSLILFTSQLKFLSGLGGFGAKAVIKNIMQKVLTDDLGKEFNWQGRGEKRPFSRLGLTDIIKGNTCAVINTTHILRLLGFIYIFTSLFNWYFQ